MNLASVDLNLLVALDALLAERNLTRAGQRLNLSQPAMSASLSRLRNQFDDPLLVRDGRAFLPTTFAESLVEPVREILSRIEQALDQRSSFDPSVDSRVFTVVASDYIAVTWLRPMFARLAADSPNVMVAVTPYSADAADQLRRGEVDLLILPREVTVGFSDLPHEPLFTERFVCAVWRDHPTVGKTMTVEQLSTLPYVAYGSGATTTFIDSQLDLLGIPRQVEVTTQSFFVTPFLLKGTRFFTLIQEQLALYVRDIAEIRVSESPVALEPVTQSMYWHPRRTEDPSHQWLRHQVSELAAAVGQLAT